MQIICISRGSQSNGEDFAKNLAAKLDYECISREYLLEEATRRRIPIGKLETSIIKPHLFTDKLAHELEHYKALATSILCEKALNGNLIYHGRTGHLLLPGISHILKLRVVADTECRIKSIMEKMKLPREKAKQYIEQIDEDRKKWVKTFYNTQWDVFTQYEFIVNMSFMNINNVSTALCSMAQLPEFQSTPSSINALKDLYLESQARLVLFSDRRTNTFNIRVKANDGRINVTYPALLAEKIDIIDESLRNLADVKEIIYTKAQANILWIQEQFNVNDGSYEKVLSVANNWDAAIELLKIKPDDTEELINSAIEDQENAPETWRDTGIIAEGEDIHSDSSKDMAKIHEKLIKDGRAGGQKTIIGSRKSLINSIDKTANYKLIIFDNIFFSMGELSRKRLIREWSNSLSDILTSPVVTLHELEYRYQFKTKNWIQLIVNGLLTFLIVILVFSFSTPILEFLSMKGTSMRIIATICILVFGPIFAIIYSTVIGLLLKLIKFE